MPGLEAKNDAPIRLRGDGPKPCQIPSQGMQSKTGQIHVANVSGLIQTGQNTFNLVDLIRS